MPSVSVRALTRNPRSVNVRRQSARRRTVITIDGPAGVGKSTTAKLLAKRLGLVYLDTGATYRAVAHEVLEQGVDPRRPAAVARVARSIRLKLGHSAIGQLVVKVAGRDVTRAIRSERVTEAAAIIAQHPQVRAAMVRLQRRLARGQSIVVEGRDTGSVVFPKASYKFFLTADASVRARRRQKELLSLHGHAPSFTMLAKQLRRRDQLDRSREVGPLIRPAGSILVNTSSSGAAEVVEWMLQHLASRPPASTDGN